MRDFLKRKVRKVGTALIGIAGGDLLKIAHRSLNISNPNMASNGEIWLLKTMGSLLTQEVVFFDVGANTGTYSREILKNIPKVSVHSFEPNPEAYKSLITVKGPKHNNVGLGLEEAEKELFLPEGIEKSEHASLIEVKDDPRKMVRIPISISTLKSYCQSNNIKTIDFLKIDVEGYEMDVLGGAKEMLSDISIIQFEFNYHLVYSGHYLKTFYDLLPGHQFFRLMPDHLKDLGEYDSSNEIFIMHNIVALTLPAITRMKNHIRS